MRYIDAKALGEEVCTSDCERCANKEHFSICNRCKVFKARDIIESIPAIKIDGMRLIERKTPHIWIDEKCCAGCTNEGGFFGCDDCEIIKIFHLIANAPQIKIKQEQNI